MLARLGLTCYGKSSKMEYVKLGGLIENGEEGRNHLLAKGG